MESVKGEGDGQMEQDGERKEWKSSSKGAVTKVDRYVGNGHMKPDGRKRHVLETKMRDGKVNITKN